MATLLRPINNIQKPWNAAFHYSLRYGADNFIIPHVNFINYHT